MQDELLFLEIVDHALDHGFEIVLRFEPDELADLPDIRAAPAHVLKAGARNYTSRSWGGPREWIHPRWAFSALAALEESFSSDIILNLIRLSCFFIVRLCHRLVFLPSDRCLCRWEGFKSF